MLPLTTDLIRAFGWTLLHSIWQAFCVYACLRIVLKLWPMASSAIKYHLSFLSLAGISGWFAYTFWNQISMIKTERQIQQLAMHWDKETIQSAMVAIPQDPTGLKLMLPGMETYFPLLVAAYVIGVGVMTVKLCLDFVQLRQMKRQHLEAIGQQWEQHLVKLSAIMGVSRKVQLFISQHLQVPVMIGFLRPVILLPATMVSNLSSDQLEAILLHELAHIKRNDYLLNIFQSIVETILFFNPFIWWISKNIRIEREHCCDDLVIAGTVQPLQYAKALVALEEYRLTVNPMAMAAADDKHHLLHRIKRIMEMKRTNLNYSQRLLAMLIIVTGLVSIAWLNPAAKAGKRNNIQQDSMPAASVATPLPSADSAIAFSNGTGTATPAEVMTATLAADTTPVRKRKYIIRTDSGTVKEYNSLTEMPAEDLKKFEESYDNFEQAREKAQQRAVEWQKTQALVQQRIQQNMKIAEQQRAKAQQQMYIQGADMAKIQQQLQQTMNNAQIQQLLAQMKAGVVMQDWNKVDRLVQQNLKTVDWDKMTKMINEQMKNVDWEKMNKELQENMKKIDWKKLNEQIEENMKKINWDEINKELKEEGMNLEDRERMKEEMKEQFRSEQMAAMQNKYPTFNGAYIANSGTYTAPVIRYKTPSVTYTAPVAYSRGNNVMIYNDGAKAVSVANAKQAAALDAKRAAEESKHYMLYPSAGTSIYRTQDADVRTFLNSLAQDNLIDNNKPFEVKKQGSKLYINGKKQSNSVSRKHTQYLERDNVSITQQGRGMIMIEEKNKN